MKKIPVLFILIICIATSVVAIDIHHDRKQKVEVVGDALLLEKPFPMGFEEKENHILRVLKPGENVKVLRVTKESRFVVIWAGLEDGLTGFLIDDRNVEIVPGG